MAKLIYNEVESNIATEKYVDDAIKSSGGIKDYSMLENKPMINGVVVSGEQTGSDLGLASLIPLPDGGSKDLSDIEQELFVESTARIAEDMRIENALNASLKSAYRTAANQDIIDNAKVAKSEFTNATLNPNGHVTLWLEPVILPDSVIINFLTYQPLRGTFNPGSIALPMSDSSKAGLMTKEQSAALEQAVSDIGNLIAGAGFKEQWFDTRADLADADTSSFINGMPTVVWNDEEQGNATTKWQYAPDDTSGRLKLNGFIYGGIAQEVPYQAATTTTLGLLLSSTIAGKVNVEPNGVGSVEGWDALVARVTALENAKEQQLNFNTTHDHSGGANGAITPKDFTVYATEAEAAAAAVTNQLLNIAPYK